ncbi:serine/threonine-protein kinase ULK3 isoform X2 [Macrosteles quadrilineatus]|uniref:serine/threonine-protein kinase ULK3 isoform X2 n=1 Tax=Macrosteles quadrilineatus TaxID=74068 RepID=UPI0023E27F44|nr:serine/threonine-protein kinase ULK3 isoform X2 [Macrosteles quadrilineatus]
MAKPEPDSSKKSSPHQHSIDGYAIVEKIGAGSYSTVYKGFRTIGPRETVAIKCVEKSKLSTTGRENIITEIRMLKMLKHEYIVQMKDFQWDDRFIYIVMEYCDGGDLSAFIRKRHKLPETVCRKFMQQLATALKFLRQNNVVHLDLKPQNLLLTTQPRLSLKVGDFGFAQFLSNEAYHCSLRGSPLYMAPEMLIKRHYDAKVDLWSVGVIAYECLFGRAPYSSASIKQLHAKIAAQAPIEVPEGCVSRDCQDLLCRLLKHDPQERMSYEEFFAHPFLDLEHLPSEDSFKEGVKLIHEAVNKDANKEFKQAFMLYCQALQYFVPYIQAEQDPEKKTTLTTKVAEYTKRAEELKSVLQPQPLHRKTSPEPSVTKEKTTSTVTSTSNTGVTVTDSRSPTPMELMALCSTTPSLRDALEIGQAAQMYLAEGQYQLALDKFQASLGVLVPLLATEPLGPRKELLYRQVQDWLKQAESVKALMSCTKMDQTPIAAAENKACIVVAEACCIQ